MPPAHYVAFTHIDPNLIPGEPDFPVEERQRVGTRMRLPTKQWPKLVKRSAMSMPDHPICVAYMNWACQPGRFPTGHGHLPGVVVENKEEWVAQYGEDKLKEMMTSFRTKGQPTLHWTHIHHLDED